MSNSDSFEREWNSRQVAAGVLDGDILNELIRLGARSLQETAGLKVDGLAGPATVDELESLLGLNAKPFKPPRKTRRRPPPDLVPIPSPSNVTRIYGDFGYKENPTRPGAIIIDKTWAKQNIVKCWFNEGKQYTYLHRYLEVEFPAILKRASEASGYYPRKVWGWVPRHKCWDPKRSISLHSWGVAVDIDWHLHPYGKLNTGGPLFTPEGEIFIDVFECAGWAWGGRWKTPDPHHFERVKR